MKIPAQLYRSATFERASVNEESREVELSISSEAPYERDFGIEVLDHSGSAVDLSRMNAGAPLLFNHDRNCHLGVILSSKLEGGRLRVRAKIGENADAENRWKDIKSGVLRNASVGYQITGMKKTGKNEQGTAIYRCSWFPHEGSLVTIPADQTVGVGRNFNAETVEIDVPEEKEFDATRQKVQTQATCNKSMADDPNKVTLNEDEIRKAAITAERQRSTEIQSLVAHFRDKGLAGQKIDTSELGRQFVEQGKSVQDFRNAVMEGNFPAAKPMDTNVNVGRDEKEIGKVARDFSVVRAIRCLARRGGMLDGFEKEVSDEAEKVARRSGGDLGEGSGFFIPYEVMRAPIFKTERERALFTNVYGAAGALVGTDLMGGSMIELLRNKMYVAEMGARTMGGLTSNVAIPAQTGGATASWLAENATISESLQTVGQVALTPHRLAALTAFTTQLISQASVDVESFVREDLMKVLAIARDLAAIAGTGTSGQPLGILNTSNLSTSVTFANAQTMLYGDALAFENNVALNNADLGSLGYLTTPTVRKNAKATAEIAAANSNPVWKNDMVNGYKARATNQVPTATSVIFGNWNDLILAEWAANQVIVDPYSLAAQNQVRIVMHQLCDNALRHTKSFSVSTN